MALSNDTKYNLILLFSGKFISELGNGIYYIALSWFILSRSNGIAEFGMLMIVNALPALIIAPVAGIFIDKYPKKTLLVLCDLTQSLAFTLLVLAYIYYNVSFELLLIVSLINGLVKTVYDPTGKTIYPLLVEQNQLHKVNSIESAIKSFTNLLGIFAGGTIVTFFGVFGCFIFNACGYLFSGVCESLLKIGKAITLQKRDNLKSFIIDIQLGFKYAFATRDLALIFIFTFILAFLIMPAGYLLFPIILKNIFDFDKLFFAMIQAGFPMGIIMGAVITMFINRNRSNSPVKYFITSTLGMSLVVLSWGLLIHFGLKNSLFNAGCLMISTLIMGIINAVIAIEGTTYIQHSTDEKILGKVFSIQALSYTAVAPLGLLFFGFIINILNIAANPRNIKNIFFIITLAIPLLLILITRIGEKPVRSLAK